MLILKNIYFAESSSICDSEFLKAAMIIALPVYRLKSENCGQMIIALLNYALMASTISSTILPLNTAMITDSCHSSDSISEADLMSCLHKLHASNVPDHRRSK